MQMHKNPDSKYYYHKICVVDEHCSSASAVAMYIGSRYLYNIYNLRTTTYYTYTLFLGSRIFRENRIFSQEKNCNNLTLL